MDWFFKEKNMFSVSKCHQTLWKERKFLTTDTEEGMVAGDEVDDQAVVVSASPVISKHGYCKLWFMFNHSFTCCTFLLCITR